MNEEQSDELIQVLKEIRNNLNKTKEESIKSLQNELNLIRKKLNEDYFTLGLNEGHKKYLKDVLNNNTTFKSGRVLK